MQQARFLLRVAAVASSMLLVAGFVSFRAGVLNRFLASPAHAGISYEDSLQDAVFELPSLAVLDDFHKSPQPFVVGSIVRSDSTDAAGSEFSDRAFDVFVQRGCTLSIPETARPAVIAGSKSIVMEWSLAETKSIDPIVIVIDPEDGLLFSGTRDRPRTEPSMLANSQARGLVVVARSLLREGRLDEARQLAMEADQLKAKYDPFDDRPDLVLKDVAAIPHVQNKPAAQTSGQRTPTMMAGSKSLVGIVVLPTKAPEVKIGPVITSGSGSGVTERKRPELKPQTPRPSEVMSGSKMIVLQWKEPDVRPLMLDETKPVDPKVGVIDPGNEWRIPGLYNTTGADSMLIPLLSQQYPAGTKSMPPVPAKMPKSKSTVTDLRPLTMPSQELMTGSKSGVIGWNTEWSLLFSPTFNLPPILASPESFDVPSLSGEQMKLQDLKREGGRDRADTTGAKN